MIPAIAVESTVSVLTVSPSQVAWGCAPTSILASARVVSIIVGAPFSRPLRARSQCRLPGAQLLPDRQCGRCDQDHLEKRQSEDHAQAGRPENVSDDQPE